MLEKSCLDHIYTNSKYKCSCPTVIPFGANDHDIISYTRYSKVKPTNYPTKRGRSYKDFNITEFLTDLQNVDWTGVLICGDLDEAVKLFTTNFNYIYDKHAPWKVYQIRKNYAPWITEEMKALMAERDRWKEVVKHHNTILQSDINIEEKENAIKNFKYYRHQVNNKKKNDEVNFKRQKIAENIQSSQKTWSLSKQFMNWKSTGSPH